MATPNANNEANYQEIEAHCKLASAKLARLVQSQAPASSALEDLEDYYDRQVQLRVMANTTLREQLSEAELRYATLQRQLWQSLGGGVALAGAWLVAVDPWAAYAHAADYWSYGLVACVGYLLARTTL